MTQVERIIRYLEEHPGASHLELTQALAIANVTGRISDCRVALAPSRTIDCIRVNTVHRYWIRQLVPQQGELGLTA